MKDEEIWKPVVGYEGLYEASNLGRIKSLSRTVKCSNGNIVTIKERVLKNYPTKSGYYNTVLSKEGISTPYRLHRIILKAFTDPVEYHKTVNHKDGIKANNCLCNLEWLTCQENVAHSFKYLNKAQRNHRYFFLDNGADKKLGTTKGAFEFYGRGWMAFYNAIRSGSLLNGYTVVYLGKMSMEQIQEFKNENNL